MQTKTNANTNGTNTDVGTALFYAMLRSATLLYTTPCQATHYDPNTLYVVLVPVLLQLQTS